jgi:prepilin-type N-terminal cleavage/methylation domain-containing protein
MRIHPSTTNDLNWPIRAYPRHPRFFFVFSHYDNLRGVKSPARHTWFCGAHRRARRPRSRPESGLRAPRGFTLFELLVVVAILATVVAVSWPALDRFYLEYRVRQAGQLVQARLAGARVHAIDTGYDYQFRFEPDGQRFLVLPYDSQALAALQTASSPTTATAGTSPTVRIPRIAGVLPSTTAHFDSTSAGGSAPQQIPAEWLAGLADADKFSGVNWSAPLVFHADGSATTAQVIIRDKKSRFVIVSVRAMTGGVTVSAIENGGTR